jgi:hypothetical protein
MLALAFLLAPPDIYPASGEPSKIQSGSSIKMNSMRIQFVLNGRTFTGRLDDNPTARDFYSMLPMTLTLQDYSATEKISYLPRRLSDAGAPEGVRPSLGDIGYYAPWGNLAIFYKGFGYSKGLIKLGRFDSGVDELKGAKEIAVLIEPVEQMDSSTSAN